MPKGKKVGGRDFPPGVSGNPAGRAPVPPELKAAKKLTAQLFQDCVNKLTQMSMAEIKEYLKDPKCTSLEAMIAGQILAGVKGKTQPVNLLLDRTMGTLKQQVEHSGIPVNNSQVIITIPSNGRDSGNKPNN